MVPLCIASWRVAVSVIPPLVLSVLLLLRELSPFYSGPQGIGYEAIELL
jgi:hypothetical protein